MTQEHMNCTHCSSDQYSINVTCANCGVIYKALPNWVGLNWDDLPEDHVGDKAFLQGAKWAKAKLREKNTWQDGDCKHCVNGCPACDARRQPNVLP